MATKRSISGELDRTIQYDILANMEKVSQCCDTNLIEGYQGKEDSLPDVDRVIDRHPEDIVLEGAEVAITYEITYDKQEMSFVAYSEGENVGLYVKGNGKSTKFISDFREAALENPTDGEVNGTAVSIKNLLSN